MSRQVRLWQSLVVMSSFVPRSESGEALAVVLGQVAGNNPPTIKQYMEAVAAALVLREVRGRGLYGSLVRAWGHAVQMHLGCGESQALRCAEGGSGCSVH